MINLNYQSKNTTSWNNQDKSDVSPAGVFDEAQFGESTFDDTDKTIETRWVNYIRRGKVEEVGSLEDYIFTDEILINGQTLEETTQELNDLKKTEWTNQTKS